MSEIAAAERLRRCANGENPIAVYDPQKPKMRLGEWGRYEIDEAAKDGMSGDCETLADAYLAEHPADDATPLDEAWLSATFGPHLPSGPRKRYSLHFAMVRGMSVSWCPPCGNLPACICIESLAIIESPTRGTVRSLARVLGIPLTGDVQ